MIDQILKLFSTSKGLGTLAGAAAGTYTLAQLRSKNISLASLDTIGHVYSDGRGNTKTLHSGESITPDFAGYTRTSTILRGKDNLIYKHQNQKLYVSFNNDWCEVNCVK